MRFTLTYDGRLRSNGGIKHKHQVRRSFHAQLAVLWTQPPLSDARGWFEKPSLAKRDLNRLVGEYRFVPLVSPVLHLACELEIFMLRPGPPGEIIAQGGDIDNRLKTLFDALRLPTLDELPMDSRPSEDENPFFCLLEDDALITKVAVQTDRLLRVPESPSEVRLHIRVQTLATQMVAGNQITGGMILG